MNFGSLVTPKFSAPLGQEHIRIEPGILLLRLQFFIEQHCFWGTTHSLLPRKTDTFLLSTICDELIQRTTHPQKRARMAPERGSGDRESRSLYSDVDFKERAEWVHSRNDCSTVQFSVVNSIQYILILAIYSVYLWNEEVS